MYDNRLMTRSLAGIFIVFLVTGVAVSGNMPANQNLQDAFRSTQEMFSATGACRKDGKSSCPDAIEAGKKAKRYAESALSDDISSLAKSRIRKAIEILDTTLGELSRNYLNEAEQHAAYAMGELDEARKAL